MGLRIRRSGPEDSDSIRRIAFETGFFGDSMSALLDDPKRFEPSLGCYLRPRASTAFIAETDGEVQGYAIASLTDIRACTIVAVTRGVLSALAAWPGLSVRDRRYVRSRIAAGLHAPFSEERRFRTPGGPRLHVNVSARIRGAGAGSALLAHLLDDLRARGLDRAHANSYQTARNLTESFWLKNGFAEFSRVRTAAWKRFVPDEVWLVCFARPL
ncbi:MAG TPA: hypothetical protein VNA04_15425 [Thermoanaerobaculia bacterium]|nr:hypothetical protein [Thermoanaerobaculia bacterium]